MVRPQIIRLFVLVSAFIVLSLPAGIALATDPGQEAPVDPMPPAALNAIRSAPPTYHDSFRRNDATWEVTADETHTTSYNASTYHIRVNEEKQFSWGNSSFSGDNFYVEVDAFRVDGPEDNAYGLVFRIVDKNNFYVFSASTDGYYRLTKLVDNEWDPIVDWTMTDAIDSDPDAVNRLGVLASGPAITLFINDVVVDEVDDDTFAEGLLGLQASTPGESGVEIAFDDLSVWMLDEPPTTPGSKLKPASVGTPLPRVRTLSERLAAIADQAPDVVEDFGSDTGAWLTGSDDNASIRISDQALIITVAVPNRLVWAPRYRFAPADMYMEVETTLSDGQPDSEYGFLFRFKDDDNFYFYAISGQGSYSLKKKVDGKWTTLTPWTKANVIETGAGAVNRLAVLAEDSLLTLLVNDQVVGQIVDESFTEGQVAMLVGTVEEAPLTINFDNVKLWLLGPSQVDAVTPEPPAATPLPVGNVIDRLFEIHMEEPTSSDAFSRDSGTWPTDSAPGASYALEDGHFVIEIDQPDLLAWTTNQDLEPANFLAEVDVELDPDAAQAQAGFVFRWNDKDNYFLFTVSGNGYYGLWKRVDGEWETILDWTEDAALEPAGTTNRLGLLANGTEFTLVANDIPLTTLEDDSFDAGQIGIVVGTFDEAPAIGWFDDFELWDLDQ